jgi:hypothetical protein
MKDRKKQRKIIAAKVADRVQKLKVVLNAKLILEEMNLPSKGKSFDFISNYLLNAPMGLEKC